MRKHALVVICLFGLSALIAGCPFFTRRDRGDAPPAAAHDHVEGEAH